MASQLGNPYACATAAATRRQSSCTEEQDKEISRISTHVFTKKTVKLDGLEGAALAKAILDAEKACDATVIREASGTYDGGTDVEGSAGGRVASRVTGINHLINGTDPNYVGNELWWASMRSQQSQFNYLGITSSRAWKAVGYDLSISGKGPITDDLTAIEGQFTVGWNKFAPLQSVPIDTELLNEPPYLPFTMSTALPDNNASLVSTTTLEGFTVAAGDQLAYKVTFTGATTYSLRAAEGVTLPVGLQVSDQQGNLTYTAAAGDLGEYLFYLRGESDCGVLGEITARLIVTA